MTQLELELDGMSCASCAAGIERALNRLDGVEATVNFATERAAVAFDPERASVDELVGAVESIGYGARERTPLAAAPPDRLAPLRRRLIVAVALSIPLAVLAMVPAGSGSRSPCRPPSSSGPAPSSTARRLRALATARPGWTR